MRNDHKVEEHDGDVGSVDSDGDDTSRSDDGDSQTPEDGSNEDDECVDVRMLDDRVTSELLGGGSYAGNRSGGPGEDVSHGEFDDSDDDAAAVDYDYDYSSPDALPWARNPLSGDQLERIEKVELAAKKVAHVVQKYVNAPLPPSLDPNDYTGSCRKHGDKWEIDPGSAWANMPSAMEEIVNAREEMIKAWDDDDDGTDEGGMMGDNNEGGLARIGSQREGGQKHDAWWKPILVNHESAANVNETDGFQKQAGTDMENDVEATPLTKEEHAQFEEVHMEWATDAFAEELDALRTGQLERLTRERRQKKKGAAATGSERDESSSALELDPMQYSFVVKPPSGGGRMVGEADNGDGGGGMAPMATAVVEEIDVNILADMLRSGGDCFSTTEKRMLLRARQRAVTTAMMATAAGPVVKEGDMDDRRLTLHERRKRELGLLVL